MTDGPSVKLEVRTDPPVFFCCGLKMEPVSVNEAFIGRDGQAVERGPESPVWAEYCTVCGTGRQLLENGRKLLIRNFAPWVRQPGQTVGGNRNETRDDGDSSSSDGSPSRAAPG